MKFERNAEKKGKKMGCFCAEKKEIKNLMNGVEI